MSEFIYTLPSSNRLTHYQHFRATPATGALGADVVGLDLRDLSTEGYAELRQALLHHKVLFIHGQALSVSERLAETRKALWRLFVAGFCMMQVMMYAWPAYVAEPGEMPADIDQLLRWASWVLSVPVVTFASGPFFRGAWRDLKLGRVGMDTPVSIGILVTFGVSSAATSTSSASPFTTSSRPG